MAKPPNRPGIGPDEYVWAAEVHSFFGESLNFFFVSTAYSIRTVKEFQQIIASQSNAVTAYMIFGQFDFLVRSWGTRKENEALYQKLAEFTKDNLGACKLLEASDVFYAWSPSQPSVEDVRTFCQTIADIESESKRAKYVSKHFTELKVKSLVLDKMDTRIGGQGSRLKAFSVIRNVALSAASFDLLNKSIRSWLREHAWEKDATLYKTRGESDFIVRWASPDFPKLAEQIIGLTRAIDADGAAAISETYFVDKLLGTTKDNFRLQARRSGVNHNAERKLSIWYKAIPALAKIPRDRRDYLLTVCNNAELRITPSELETNRPLRGVLEAFLAEAKDDFAARVMAFYSNFESRFRSELLRILWKPVSENDRPLLLERWRETLGRNTPIDTGSDGGERVPKLALGDCVRLATREFPELLPEKRQHALRELVSMRNKLGHFGTEALAWRDLEVFLRQVRLCSTIMTELQTPGQTKRTLVHYEH